MQEMAPVRLGRPVRHRPGARRHVVDQLHHRARRLHTRRPDAIRAQAQRGERRAQQRRREHQLLREFRGGRTHRRPQGADDPRTDAHEHARYVAAFARHADDAGGRRVQQFAVRQQQRLLPGQRHHVAQLGLARLRQEDAGVPPHGGDFETHRDPQVARHLPSRGLLHATEPAGPTQAVEPRAVAAARRHHADGTRLVRHVNPLVHHASAEQGRARRRDRRQRRRQAAAFPHVPGRALERAVVVGGDDR